MPDEKPAASAAEEEIIKKKEEPIAEETPAGDDPSPYQEELDRIESENKAERERLEAELETERQSNAERERQLALKDKAIDAEKKKTLGVKDSWKLEVKEELRQERLIERTQEEIDALTDDPAARKVIRHHLEHSIVRTGDPREDALSALAIANRKRVMSLLSGESADDAADARSISSMRGGDLPGGSSFTTSPSAAARTAARLTSAFAGRDKEKAKKLAERAAKNLK